MLASSLGIRGAEIVAGLVALAGLLLTLALLPEPKGKSLEELSDEAYAPARTSLEPAHDVPDRGGRRRLTAREFLVKTVSEIAPSPQVALSTVLAEGDPTESLIVASRGADMLVLGIRGRTRFAGLMLGSVSQACAANAACPVVLVKRSDEARKAP